MATWYVDNKNGNDSNNGTSTATPVKNLGALTGAGKTPAAGDTIKFAKSPAPTRVKTSGGSNIDGTWANPSMTIGLSDAATADITTCESSWTASTNVTTNTSTIRKEGSLSSSIAIASAFTTGKIAYFATGTLDLSGYTKINFWIRSTLSHSSGQFRLDLCSDTTGDTPVHSVTIGAITGSTWTSVVFDNGSALSSSIQSVSITALSDPGAPTLLLDNIFVGNDLTLWSLVSKDSADQGVTDGWYPVMNVRPTQLQVDYSGTAGTPNDNHRGYCGTAETVAIYCRDTIQITTTQNTTAQGNSSSSIDISGGWDFSSGLQDGETYLDLSLGSLNGFNFASGGNQYINVSKINFVRCATAFVFTGSSSYTGISIDCSAAHGATSGMLNTSSVTFLGCTFNLRHIYGTGASPFNTNASLIGCTFNVRTIGANLGINLASASLKSCSGTIEGSNNGNGGFFWGVSSDGCDLTLIGKYNGGPGITCQANCFIANGTFTNNGSNSGVVVSYGIKARFYSLTHTSNFIVPTLNAGSVLEAYSATIGEGTPSVTANGARLTVQQWGGVAGDFRVYCREGVITVDSSTVHTASSNSIKFAPSSNSSSDAPLYLETNAIGVDTTASTFSVYVYRSNTGLTARLRTLANKLPGISNASTSAIGGATTWEQLTLNGTATTAGGIPVRLECWDTAGTKTCYFDDFSAT